MNHIDDLPLFEHALAHQRSCPELGSYRREPQQRIVKARSGVTALSLARSRPVVAQLAERFRATQPGPHRAATFRRDVVMPLVRQRQRLGLSETEVQAEVVAIEEAILRMLLRSEPSAGTAA